MPSDTGDTRRSAARPHGGSPAGSEQDQPQQPQLPCPRCDSINTKFCYYNNYNFSQPRHFCKSCRRYWTQGGTLRDIPVGGGSRKSAKRSRTNAGVVATDATSIGPLQATPVLFPGGGHCGSLQLGSAFSLCGSFTSLLNGNITTSGHASASNGTGGFIGLGGFGLGLGPALEDVGFGIGRSVWPFSGFTDGSGGGGAGVGSNGGPAVQMHNTWQLESIENNSGYVAAGDCFAWPDLAISTPGNTLK